MENELNTVSAVDVVDGIAYFANQGNGLYIASNDLVGIDETQNAIPVQFALRPNYPNPFNPTTTIRYDLPTLELVTLKVCDILGQEVATLVNEKQAAGEKSVVWYGKSNFGQQVSSGIYL